MSYYLRVKKRAFIQLVSGANYLEILLTRVICRTLTLLALLSLGKEETRWTG